LQEIEANGYKIVIADKVRRGVRWMRKAS